MSGVTDVSPQTGAEPKRDRRLWIVSGLVALLVLAAVGLAYYWIDWKIARQDWRDQGPGDRLKAHQAFLEDIQADRFDAAYRSTTASFQRQVSREAFEERARRGLAFERKPGARAIEAGGGSTGPNRETYTFTVEDEAGTRLRTSITVVQEDSIFFRRPPSPQVAEFMVEEQAPKAAGKP